ncbi:hypothetical protein PAHAL_1G367300 [Panicum hallii]|uniref:Uncharacterized protein n=1 Tax=Panicum hallii TaxID=206008 RepID=A0A2T8KXE1_9POAL|nr:uncharacterized protein LOC112876577 [Panicum hallii]PVH66847.1 hypothetical protein PAHAL_1G367300 [Panicum hallii]
MFAPPTCITTSNTKQSGSLVNSCSVVAPLFHRRILLALDARMAATGSTPTMPATVTPLPGYGYQGSAAGAEPLRSSSGSIGTFFGVFAAVLLLTLLSCVFGRVCAAQAEGPDERYDCTRLARRWCGWPAHRRAVVKREAKPPPPVVEAPAALPPPEEP